MKRRLTVRAVRVLLTRAGVDHTDLTISGRHSWVIVTGPEQARRRAAEVLYNRGLACAPFPDRDEWSRGGTD